ncbi:phenylacetate--CoA ligase family protein [Empedobacter falsenii]|uniref:AMP-binding protein n=1 Tax=Empedobacter falsenii TaxID=343874 RepID=A0AAW7DLH2_9FLAO|nr:AMP-binding protein [Empedobacter falsenii]MDM1551777.1 AMP-binding protein [Empedobacter falsenii]
MFSKNALTSLELRSLEEIKEFQNQKLQEQIKYLATHSKFYQDLFKKQQIDWQSIQTTEDLKLIPVTTKNDLQQYNFDFLCVPPTEIIDYSTTSGTLGDPVTFGLTDKDLDRLATNEMNSFQRIGVQKGDVVQLMTTIDRRFMAGLAYFLGLRKIGAGIIRVGAGVPQLQWDSILKYQPKFLVAVPSFLLKMLDYAEKNNIDYQNSSVKSVLCIGESLRDKDLNPSLLTQKINSKWNIQLFSTYASTEMGTAFTECDESFGGHHQPDLIITEILDENNEVVQDGELGELTITTLGIEGMPLLRFKTGDLLRKHSDKCKCGSNSYRLGPVEGRKQHMIKYKGTTLYPPALHDILNHFDEIKLHLIEIYSNEFGTDEILIRLVSSDETDDFLAKIKDYFRAKLRVTPSIKFETFEELQSIVFKPESRKPITFVDYRES